MDYMKKTVFMLPVILLGVAGCQESGPDDVPQQLSVPGNVRCTELTATTATFVWDEVEGAEVYTARLEGASGELKEQLNTAYLTCTFENLEEGAHYSFMVRSSADGRTSDFSEPLAVTAGGTVPDPEPEPDPEPDVPDDVYSQFMIPEAESSLGALAFPGAEGGGMYTSGGRASGTKVIHVTNLNDSGSGSLRAAVETSGPRIVVFDVAGRISLSKPLKIEDGDITIAGQTAPGDGICISDNTVEINADNVVIRFLRFRLGDKGSGLGDGSDAFWGRYNDNVIIDHCSMSWSIDECASFYANRNFTMQWCVLSEALNESLHGKGSHGYGGIWGGKNASFHHNLLAHNNSRNARIDHPQVYGSYVNTHRGNVDYRNNVIYNWGSNSTYGGEAGHFNIVGNYYKPGPGSSSDRRYFVDAYWYYEKDGKVYAEAYPELYLEGNYHTKGIDEARYEHGIYLHDQSGDAGRDNPDNTVLTAPLPIRKDDSKTCYTSTHDAAAAFERVTAYAGASLARDAVDERAAQDAKNGSATFGNGIIDSQDEVGGWPAYVATDAELDASVDTDRDGMPDAFEEKFGLDPDDASDGAAVTLDKYGRYTNLEMYLHYIVRDIVAAQTAGGTYQALD